MIKSRIMKKSKRGIYIQDKELVNTLFNIGKNFKYLLDIKNHKIVILPSDIKTNNTISKRKYGETVKPVIDIRSKDALHIFNSNYLELKIAKDKIIIQEYDTDKETNLRSVKVEKNIKVNKLKKVIEISKEEIANSLRLVASGESLNHVNKLIGIIDSEYSHEENIITDYCKNATISSKLPLTVCSIFSGAGLMDRAFFDDFDIIFALDSNRAACKTYKRNLGDHIVNEDITKISKDIPHATVFIGGSPCQGFSNSNRITSYLDNPKNLLVKEYIKAVKYSNPYVFVLENVPQILTAGKGQFIEEIKNELADYEITYSILNAVDFGVAQKRKRAVIIGSKIGKINIFTPIRKAIRTVKDAFVGLTNRIANQLDYSKSTDIAKKRMSYIPMGGNVFDIPKELRPRCTHSNSYLRLHLEEPAATIVNPRKSMILHPIEDRIISIRECARLQGVDDDFLFCGTLSEKQQQVCNGIAVPMFKYISNIIKKYICKYNKRIIV